MKLHPIIATLICGALISLQTWTVVEVVNLKVQVAVLVNQIKPGNVVTR